MLHIRPLFMCARGKARAMLLPSEFPDQAGLAADALPDTRGTFEPQVHMEGAVSGIPLQACHEDGAVAAHGDRGRIHAVIAQFRAGRAVELMFPGHARVGTEALDSAVKLCLPTKICI